MRRAVIVTMSFGSRRTDVPIVVTGFLRLTGRVEKDATGLIGRMGRLASIVRCVASMRRRLKARAIAPEKRRALVIICMKPVVFGARRVIPRRRPVIPPRRRAISRRRRVIPPTRRVTA
jgi:hypothetical protein